jgi:hypothetical protein
MRALAHPLVALPQRMSLHVFTYQLPHSVNGLVPPSSTHELSGNNSFCSPALLRGTAQKMLSKYLVRRTYENAEAY